MSVQRSQPSIERGQAASYVVQVTTENGSASDVSVALTAQPSSQKPTFTSGCAKGDGTASCNIGSVTTKQPTTLHAQIAIASTATSVSSVKLTATASVATTANWTPPAAAETTAVTAAASATSTKNTKKEKHAKDAKNATTSTQALPEATQMAALPLGPIPALNGEASTRMSTQIGAGNAAGLFPVITPSPNASPTPQRAASQQSKHRAASLPDASQVSLSSTSSLTAKAVGLIVLGLAIMLTVTRLSARRRTGKPPD